MNDTFKSAFVVTDNVRDTLFYYRAHTLMAVRYKSYKAHYVTRSGWDMDPPEVCLFYGSILCLLFILQFFFFYLLPIFQISSFLQSSILQSILLSSYFLLSFLWSSYYLMQALFYLQTHDPPILYNLDHDPSEAVSTL